MPRGYAAYLTSPGGGGGGLPGERRRRDRRCSQGSGSVLDRPQQVVGTRAVAVFPIPFVVQEDRQDSLAGLTFVYQPRQARDAGNAPERVSASRSSGSSNARKVPASGFAPISRKTLAPRWRPSWRHPEPG